MRHVSDVRQKFSKFHRMVQQVTAPAAALAFAVTLSACSGSTEPPTVATVSVQPNGRTILVGPGGGETLLLAASARDGNGQVIPDRIATWSTSASAIAAIASTGLVSAIAPGSATISATIDGRIGTTQITVQLVPVAAITVTPSLDSVIIGQTRQLSAALRDSAGNALTGRTLLWSSSVSTVATVSNTGLVTMVSAGMTTIAVSSEGQSAVASIVVLPSQGPVITSVSPTILTPGAIATIAGTRFAQTASAHTLKIRGVVVPVATATATQLTFTVPCIRSGAAALSVSTADGPSDTLTVTFNVTQRTLNIGQSLILTDGAPSSCNELPATNAVSRYLVVAYSAATSQNTQIDIELGGNDALMFTGAHSSVQPLRPGQPLLPMRRAEPVANTTEGLRERAHLAHLERERQLYQQLRTADRRTVATTSDLRALRLAMQAPPPIIGDMRSLYYNFGGCSDSTQIIRGRVIYAGTRAIIWEDSANTIQSTVDAPLAGYYQRLGQIFDQEQYDVIRTTFSDPLRRDPITDNDGRVHMVFTQLLNGSGAAAYVTSCDQSPRNTGNRAGSNFGEFFYGIVPTVSTSNINTTNSPDGWFYFMARTVVHEVKHIASQAARFENNAPTFEQSWLEEGTARHAEEVWIRSALHQVPWKGNTGYGTAATNGIYCDFNPLIAACLSGDALRRPGYGMRRHFNEIRPKLLDPWDWSPYGDGTTQSGSVFYQTAWSLVRYTVDRYSASDAAFFTALTNATTNGVTNLSTVAGASMTRLIGGWGLSLIADDYPGLSSLDADANFPTWNLRDIYGGLNTDATWGTRFNTPYPITPTTLAFGSFSVQQPALRGGAHVYFQLQGNFTQSQLLHLRGPNGGAMPGFARLAIVRVQ